MLNRQLRDLGRSVLGADMAASGEAIKAVREELQGIQAIQAMRENAQVIKDLYAEYPSLDAMTLGVYYCGPDELDIFVRDVVVDGEDDDEMELELVDVLTNMLVDSPVAGKLNSDGDMRKFYDVISDEDPKSGARILETTRDRVERALQSEDPNALAANLFPREWARLTEGLREDSSGENRKLTVFADTTESGLIVRLDIDEAWLDRVESLTSFAREHKVDVSMPIEMALSDSSDEAFETTVSLIPRADGVDAVEFSFYFANNPSETVTTPLIGVSEFRQAIAAGEQTYCADFGLERLDEETAMEAFGLNRSRPRPGVGG